MSASSAKNSRADLGKKGTTMFIKSGFRMLAPVLVCWMWSSSSTNAQAPGKVAQPPQDSAFSKEKLFDGTGLSAEQQNGVLGNLLKYQIGSPKTGVLSQGVFDAPGPVRPKTGIQDMSVFGAPGPMRVVPAAQIPGPMGMPGTPATDPCAGPASDKQLKALHSMLSATMAAKSLDQKTFAAKAPNGCNAEQLRYYLNVVTQLFPDGGGK